MRAKSSAPEVLTIPPTAEPTTMAPRTAAALFDALAHEYDEVRRDLGWDPFVHVAAAIGTGPLDGLRVLDVGCGTGEVAARLSRRGATVHAFDVSPRMCALTRARVPDADVTCGDLAEGLPFSDSAFDAAIALGCIEYVPDIEAAIGELARVTRPGGTLLTVIELCGPDCPDGRARTVPFLDDWVRHRRSPAAVDRIARRWLAAEPGPDADGRHPAVTRVPGYVLEDSGERVQYARLLGRVRRSSSSASEAT